MDILCSTKRDVATLTPQPKNIVDCPTQLTVFHDECPRTQQGNLLLKDVRDLLSHTSPSVQIDLNLSRNSDLDLLHQYDGRSAEETTQEANWAILRPNCSGMSTNQRPQGIGTPLVTTWTIPPPA